MSLVKSSCSVASKMIRVTILISLAVIVSARIHGGRTLSAGIVESPYNLRWLYGAKSQRSERPVCKTEECEKAAKLIMGNMNKSVDPCNDFYEFVCGNWATNNPIPEGEMYWGVWPMVQKKVELQVDEILKSKQKPDDILAVKLAKRWYSSCMNTDRIEERGVEPLVTTMARIGGWPMAMEPDEWDEHEYNWQRVDDYYARLIGKNAFHHVSVGSIFGDNTEMYIRIEETHVPPGTESLWFEEDDDDYGSREDGSMEGSQEPDSREPGSEQEFSREEETAEDNSQYDDDNDESDIYGDNQSNDNEEDESEGDYYYEADDDEQNEEDNDVNENEIGTGNDEKENNETMDVGTGNEEYEDNEIEGDKEDEKGDEKVDDKVDEKEDEKGDEKVDEKVDEKEDEKEDDSGELIKKMKKNRKRKVVNAKRRIGHKKLRKEKSRISRKVVEHKSRGKNKVNVHKKVADHKKMRRGTKGIEKRAHRIKSRSKRAVINRKDRHVYGKKQNTHDKMRVHNVRVKKHKLRQKHRLAKSRKQAQKFDNTEEESVTMRNNDDSEDTVEVKPSLKERYMKYIAKVTLEIAEARGADINTDTLAEDISDMLRFQTKLFKLVIEFSDANPNTTLHEFQDWYNSLELKSPNSKVNWFNKVSHLFNEAGVEISGDEFAIIAGKEYFEGLRTLLETTPSRTIVNYVHWNFLSRLLKTSTKELRSLSFYWNRDFDDDGDEGESITKRSERCSTEVEMSDIMAYEFVKQYFSDDIVKTASDMIDGIQKEVEYQIKDSTWINEETKDFLLEKLMDMDKFVGYPDWYRNDTVVKRYFRGLVVGLSYYENTLSYMRYYKWKYLQSLVRENTLESWFIDPMTLNAFFIPDENSITITAADFQSPLFDFNRPSALNYGIIGVVMAHEVNHGYDDNGRLYDKHGGQTEWLSEMARAYSKRAECFVNQFNKYSVIKGSDMNIDGYGNQTIDENIADTMGLEATFRAYQRRQRECENPDVALPGLEEFSNEQLFFISFGNLWCEVMDPFYEYLAAGFDSHSTGRLRVIGSISNSQDFAAAFKCPAGSPMNPERKCNIWK